MLFLFFRAVCGLWREKKGKIERRRKQVEMWRFFFFSSCSEQMSAANYKRGRTVITHETRIYLWGEHVFVCFFFKDNFQELIEQPNVWV